MSEPGFRKAHPKVILPGALSRRRPLSDRLLDQAYAAKEAGDITLSQLFGYFASEVLKLERITGPIVTTSWWTGFTAGLLIGGMLALILMGVA